MTDTINSRVQMFDPTGQFQFELGSEGADVGQFNQPRFATVDSVGNIFVADSYNDRVQVFDNAGNYQFGFGSLGTQPGQFDKPYGIAVDDSTGNIFVVDHDNDRIQVFDSTGNFLITFGSEGSAPGQLTDPTSIAIGDGRLYVTEEYGHRVSVFRLGPTPRITRRLISTATASSTVETSICWSAKLSVGTREALRFDR